MSDIPRWPKVSLLDDPDEEERARQRLNESRRQRGLPPLYPESGFPPRPSMFGGILPGLDQIRDPRDVDPGFSKEHFDFVDGDPGVAAPGDQVAEAPPPSSPPAAVQRSEGAIPDAATQTQSLPEAKPAPSGKPLTYEQIKQLVRENNRSSLPDEMIIAVIFKESSFNPSARGNTTNNPTVGLMQLKEISWRDVHQRALKQKAIPDFLQNAFDPATNIQRGSAFLQLRINDRRGDIAEGLALYGPKKTEDPNYVADILAATKALQQNPRDPVAVLSQVYRRKYR